MEATCAAVTGASAGALEVVMVSEIPEAAVGSIGGSGTMGIRFPEDFDWPDVRVIQYFEGFETPFGTSRALFKLLEIGGERVLRVADHGWYRDDAGHVVPILHTAPQVAWIFGEAGVDWAIVDGTAGGIANPRTNERSDPPVPWSVVVPHDFIQYWMAPESRWDPAKPFHRMAHPFCSSLRGKLFERASKEHRFPTVYDRGVYVSAPPGRLETVAEIRMMGAWGAHLVGQTLGLEAPLMRQREKPIHFAGIFLISNFAEGAAKSHAWVADEETPTSYSDFYRECALPLGNVLLDVLNSVIQDGLGECRCRSYGFSGFDEFPVRGA